MTVAAESSASPSDAVATVGQLRTAIQAFVDERDWRQFHLPKNLAMSLAIEAAELMEHFQWVDAAASADRGRDPVHREAIADEMADVACYLLSLSNTLEIDLSAAIFRKLAKNAAKYPVESSRGRAERPSLSTE